MEWCLLEGAFIADKLWGAYDFWQILEFLLRIVVATACGACVGMERSRRFKEAGIRTHCVVAMASAALMILSKYCFVDITSAGFGDNRADASRIASQVVTGISFLGAGAIFKNGSIIKGLTTAAGIWATSAIGMAIGSGMYAIGIFVTLMILLVQFIMHKFKFGVDKVATYGIIFTAYNSEELRTAIKQKFADWEAIIEEVSVEKRSEGLATYNYSIKTGCAVTDEMKREFFDSRSDVVYYNIKKL